MSVLKLALNLYYCPFSLCTLACPFPPIWGNITSQVNFRIIFTINYHHSPSKTLKSNQHKKQQMIFGNNSQNLSPNWLRGIGGKREIGRKMQFFAIFGKIIAEIFGSSKSFSYLCTLLPYRRVRAYSCRRVRGKQ